MSEGYKLLLDAMELLNKEGHKATFDTTTVETDPVDGYRNYRRDETFIHIIWKAT